MTACDCQATRYTKLSTKSFARGGKRFHQAVCGHCGKELAPHPVYKVRDPWQDLR